ncbi:hypothetical protein JK358_38425 [Nocardia sp. 2]|uniref:Uncharacterized protein n=1 Tax=Nocardia acididurans TaxID=2802282 RepID=A0ABS1MLJ2_9NOCA|nr:hypothetical protein [Nocardia acididurans]MBL1080288.1 hypothetical protein [Nocardia acididurans]
MRKATRKPTVIELALLVVALVIGFGIATYWGNLIAGIAVVIAIGIAASELFYTKKQPPAAGHR